MTKRDTAEGKQSKIKKGMPITDLGYIGSVLEANAKLVKTVHVYKKEL